MTAHDDHRIDLGLAGKSAIVTGATGGIGREVAGGLARAGCRVAVVDLDEHACEEVTRELGGDGHLAVGADLRDVTAHPTLVERVRSEFGRLDILVCLAAVLRRREDVLQVTEEDWDIQHDVNLKSVFFLNCEFVRNVRQDEHGGRIINFTSQGWWSGGFGGSVAYAASKGGIVSMSRGLARSFAPYDITVNTVAPGAVDTPMMRSGMTERDLAAFVETIPLRRMATPDELVGTVLFLASDLARYVTGATVNVSGGQLMY